MQVDPKDAQTAALKREVQLLRAENAYLRGQLSGIASSGDATAGLPMGLPSSGSILTATSSQPLDAVMPAASRQPLAEVGSESLAARVTHKVYGGQPL